MKIDVTIEYDIIPTIHLLEVGIMPKQHRSLSTARLLKDLQAKGFKVSEKSKRGTITITPPAGMGGPLYHTHGTESAFHQIKRDVKKHYGVEL